MLFKHIYLSHKNPGHVVYLELGETSTCKTQEQKAETTMIACFVTESEAQNYCEYRSHMLERYGTTDVEEILDFNA